MAPNEKTKETGRVKQIHLHNLHCRGSIITSFTSFTFLKMIVTLQQININLPVRDVLRSMSRALHSTVEHVKNTLRPSTAYSEYMSDILSYAFVSAFS